MLDWFLLIGFIIVSVLMGLYHAIRDMQGIGR